VLHFAMRLKRPWGVRENSPGNPNANPGCAGQFCNKWLSSDKDDCASDNNDVTVYRMAGALAMTCLFCR